MAEVRQQVQQEHLPVSGMHCAGCASNVQDTLSKQPGVVDAQVNYADASVSLEYDASVTSLDTLQQVVRDIGYDLYLPAESAQEDRDFEADRQRAYLRLRRNVWLSIGFAIPVVIIGMFFPDLPNGRWIMWLLTTPVVFAFGSRFFRGAWQQLQRGRANMDTLVAMSTSIAYLLSVVNTLYPDYLEARGMEAHVYFEAAAVIITFILIGRLLEDRAKLQTSQAIRSLMDLQPPTVMRIGDDGQPRQVQAAEVQVDDVLLVRPGDQIAVDGVVVDGSSYIDESMITGEPLPAVKTAGDRVFTGTINQKGSFQMRATEVGAATMLARMIKTVREAQGSKAPVQHLVDRIAAVFVPIVIMIAVLSFAAWLLWGGDQALTYGLLSMVTVLVIACPCALGLATPTALMVGIGRAAQSGILIKDATSLELSHKLDAVLLDKTGTITEGKPAVTDIQWFAPGADKMALTEILHALETRSEHPLAGAIVRFLALKKARPVVIDDFVSVTGKGVKGKVHGRLFAVGTRSFAEGICGSFGSEVDNIVAAWHGAARTVVYYVSENGILAVLGIADPVKRGSQEAVQQLRGMGIDVFLLTGDSKATADAVASVVGIEQVHARLLPEAKARFVQELRNQGKVVAVVGDGINDTQALTEADVGIAMGTGSDIAIDVAAITIVSADLRKVPQAILLSRRTTRTIRQNLFWAFIYNVIGIPVAAGVLYPFTGYLLNPMIAGAAMALSSVSVVTNSLRLRWARIAQDD
ncbi:MAG: heavy metal translocating P-type ATPase [Saprospiraceae bacterium]|nr:heavy metal translocating P-type ATPase [Saprospiraceae bacterium]